jgi:hypothetical protein
MNKPLVVILMGSKADLAHCQKIARRRSSLGSDLCCGSARRTRRRAHAGNMLRQYEATRAPKCISPSPGAAMPFLASPMGGQRAGDRLPAAQRRLTAARTFTRRCACLRALPRRWCSNRPTPPCWRPRSWGWRPRWRAAVRFSSAAGRQNHASR